MIGCSRKRAGMIIIAHALDGGEMLRSHKFPKEIVDIAEQHHGTTLLKFFYHKAKKQDESTLEAAYRYPGPRAIMRGSGRHRHSRSVWKLPSEVDEAPNSGED